MQKLTSLCLIIQASRQRTFNSLSYSPIKSKKQGIDTHSYTKDFKSALKIFGYTRILVTLIIHSLNCHFTTLNSADNRFKLLQISFFLVPFDSVSSNYLLKLIDFQSHDATRAAFRDSLTFIYSTLTSLY